MRVADHDDVGRECPLCLTTFDLLDALERDWDGDWAHESCAQAQLDEMDDDDREVDR